MADTPSSGAPIEALLQERARFQQWLAKLDAAAGTAPPAVRQKVRADYYGRLEAVIQQLKSYAANIQEELDRFRVSERELESRRTTADETLAEAQVRYAVGEYSDDQWNRLSAEGNSALETLKRELANVGSEIARLVEVQALIAEPTPAARAEAEAEPEPEPEPEAVAEQEPEPVAAAPHPRPAPPIEMLPDPIPDMAAAAGAPPSLDQVPDYGQAGGAPRFVPRPAAEAPARPAARPAATTVKPGAPPLDELAFLKSVGEKPHAAEERKPRRSGESAHPAESAAAAPAAAPAAQPSAKPGQASQAKTLKCGECGTLNRPTEWYCERCGAELAAL